MKHAQRDDEKRNYFAIWDQILIKQIRLEHTFSTMFYIKIAAGRKEISLKY